ncbi:MAG: DUF3501 family protein [Halioglobus sp.]|nr:DUF3501 family protein [Halioglobus sp.]
MSHLSRADLWSLEEYSELRPTFRAEVMAHKKHRQLSLGDHTRLYFEDRLTIKYQVQEMLRIEKVFEAHAINEELDAYNPLIPDGENWKATFMIEYDDPGVRDAQLAKMIGIEDKVWLRVEDCEPIFAIADEDLDRENSSKTSSVHFLRFQLTPVMITAVHEGATVNAGIEHSAYRVASQELPELIRNSLANDLQPGVIN